MSSYYPPQPAKTEKPSGRLLYPAHGLKRDVEKPSGRLLYPAHGLKRDVEKILHDFGACQSLRFSEFTAIWRRLNFSIIHAGRSGNREKYEFVEEVFKIIIKYALVPYTLQVRVGAMYLLYGIYNTQRSLPLVRIKIQLTDWPDMLTLHEELITSGHTDADYIFRKMRDVDQVFCLVASTKAHCREDQYQDMDYFVLEDDTQDPFVKIHFAPLTSVMDYDCLSVLQTIHKEYKKGKDIYKADPEHQSNGLLNLVESDVIAKIIKLRGGGHKGESITRKKLEKRPTKGKGNAGTSRKEIKMQAEQTFNMRMSELGSCSSSDFDDSPSLRSSSTQKRASKDHEHGALRRRLKEKAFTQSASICANESNQPHSMLVQGAELVPVNEGSQSGSDGSLWEPCASRRRQRQQQGRNTVKVAAKTPTKSKSASKQQQYQSRKEKKNAKKALQHMLEEEDADDDDDNSEHSSTESYSPLAYRFGVMKPR